MRRRLAKLISAGLVIMMLTMMLAACGSKDDNKGDSNKDPGEKTESTDKTETGSTQGEPEGIQEGTSFKFWTNYDIPVYLPWMDNRGSALWAQVYDNLLVRYKGDVNDLRCNIAESYDVSDDEMVYTFKIKEDVYFTNGNQVTSADFIATWDALTEYQPRALANVETYEANGDYELIVTLNAPSATFLYELPTQSGYGVVDHTLIEEYGYENNSAAVGCGPYSIEEYVSGEKFVLKANDNYHNPDRQPHIETCEIVIIPDESTAMLALENGEIDCMNTVDIETYNTLIDMGWEIDIVEDRVNPFWMNARENELLKDNVVREALVKMIDWQAVTDLVYDGMYPVAGSYFGDGNPGSYPYSDKYDYDPEAGVKMLEDAGYALTDIKVTFLADPDFTNMEVAIVSQLNNLGLTNVETVTYDGATCYGMLKSGTYEIFPCHNGYGLESPLTPYTMGLLEDGTQPVMFLKDIDEAKFQEAMDLYNSANTSGSWEEMISYAEQLADLVQEECLALGGVQVMRFYAVSSNFEGVNVAPISGILEFNHLWYAGRIRNFAFKH